MIDIASGDLEVRIDDDGSMRLGFGGEDWLGRGVIDATGNARPRIDCDHHDRPVSREDDLGTWRRVRLSATDDVSRTIRYYAGLQLVVLETRASANLTGIATGAFDRPSVTGVTFDPSDRHPDEPPEGLRALVYQHCEFGLPAVTNASLDGFFLLGHRPATGWPLCLSVPGGPALIVAPLNAFHEQIIGLGDGTLRCGWHGALDAVPADFRTELAFIGAPDIRTGLAEWGAILRERAGTIRPGRWADSLASRPSYWTDNGAAYWYRTEPGHDVTGSIVAAVDDLRARDVEVGSVQLDSWFYPHVELRPFDTDEWVVPPSAMTAWEPRDDVLAEGMAALRKRLGDPPLVAHIRHLAADAPIADEVPVWRDGPYAVPATAQGYERWLDQCVAWGVETFEHDWLVEVFFGVRALRAEPGRATAWQAGIDRAARDRGITLQWCMGTPADFAETVAFTQVTSVRTCGDHGYIATPGQLWAWFCTTNVLARVLGLMAFKDVFRTDPEIAGDNGEIEALLSALSTGPVGLGDRVGRCDVELVKATARADGILIKPTLPIASTASSMLANPAFNPELLVAETYSDQPAGRWSYVLAAHANPGDDPVHGSIRFAELGASRPVGAVIAFDRRRRTLTRYDLDATIDVELAREDWCYLVLAPLLEGDLAVIGDLTKFVTAGDARVEVRVIDGGVRVLAKGRGEIVTVSGWAPCAPRSPDGNVRFDEMSGQWDLDVVVGERGWCTASVFAGG